MHGRGDSSREAAMTGPLSGQPTLALEIPKAH